MGRSKKNLFNITLVLSIIFSIICILAVLSVQVGRHEESLQPVYIKPEEKSAPYKPITPSSEGEENHRPTTKEEPKIDEVKENKFQSDIEDKIRSFFKELDCSIEEDWTINVSPIYSVNWIKRRLNNTLSKLGYSIKDDTIYLNEKEILELKFNKIPSKGKVAIIIDDVGRSTRLNEILQEIKLPLNISILPKQRESFKMSLIGKEEGWDVLLHLPMEPKEKRWVDDTFITTNMSSKEIEERVDSYLKSLPYVQGINNHMGSLATTDENVMRSVLSIVKERGLYFVDSLTISDSTGEKVARDINLKRFAKRDVFIDNLDKREYIKSQIDYLVELSIRRGFAIGIGHLREATLLTIKDYEWDNKGVELVLLSDVL